MKNQAQQKEIAKRLGLSQATVSYALSGRAEELGVAAKTAQRIIDLARELGYIPHGIARSLRMKATMTVGVFNFGLGGQWTHRLNVGLQGILSHAGYLPFHLFGASDREEERRMIMAFLERRVDGIIMANPILHNGEACRAIVERKVPLLFLADYLNDPPDVSHVIWDSAAAVRVGVQKLVESGRRKIGFAGVDYGTELTKARYQAYRQSLDDASLPFREEWSFWHPSGLPFPERRIRVQRWLRQIIIDSNDPIDALFALNQTIGALVGNQLHEIGVSIPKQVALIAVGYSDTRIGRGQRVTMMDEPLEQLGEHGAEAILRLIKDPGGLHIRECITANRLIEGDTV